MFLPASRVLEHRRLEALAAAHLADRRDAGHHRQVGVDHAGAVAGLAGALGVRAEQRGLDPVGLGERGADRVEQPGVGRGIGAPRALDRALIDRDDPGIPRHRAVDERALARPGDSGDHGHDAERHVDVDIAQVVLLRSADLELAGRGAHGILQLRLVAEVLAGERLARAQARDVALVLDLAAVDAGARTEVDDVVGDRDGLGLVLDDEHGVALVAQLLQQLVHALDVVRVQSDRRLVEDVGDVGEARSEVPDHLGALRLAARQRARGAVERQVAETDVHERVERQLQRLRAGERPTAPSARAPTRPGR